MAFTLVLFIFDKSNTSKYGDRCLIKDFEQRPVAQELMLHPFINSMSRNVDEVSDVTSLGSLLPYNNYLCHSVL